MVAGAARIDEAFGALANPTRRAVIERLSRGPATVSELAEPFSMALPSFMQHLRVLEDSGLVRTRKAGRVRTVQIRPANLKLAAGWLAKQQNLWEKRLEQLDAYLNTMEETP